MAAEQEKEEKTESSAGASPAAEAQPGTAVAEADSSVDAAEGDAASGENRRARRAAAAKARKQRLREREDAEAIGLDTQEMIDDALVRSRDRAGKWLRRNATALQVVFVVALVGWAGWGAYGLIMAKTYAEASDAVAVAIAAERGRIGDPAAAGQPDEQGVVDPAPIFQDDAARLAAARDAFEKAARVREGSGTAAYAALALAAVELDLQKYDEALRRYESVLTSAIAKTDVELRGRALEGIALVLEAKGDKEGALARYRELEGLGAVGIVEAALYDQARLQRDLGKVEDAKATLTKLRSKLGAPKPDELVPSFLRQRTEVLTAELDPEAAKEMRKPPPITEERLKELEEQVKKAMGQAAEGQPSAPSPQPMNP